MFVLIPVLELSALTAEYAVILLLFAPSSTMLVQEVKFISGFFDFLSTCINPCLINNISAISCIT